MAIATFQMWTVNVDSRFQRRFAVERAGMSPCRFFAVQGAFLLAWATVGLGAAVPSQQRTSTPAATETPSTDAVHIEGSVYRNDLLGFTYRFPSGWTVNGKNDMTLITAGPPIFATPDSPADITGMAITVTKVPDIRGFTARQVLSDQSTDTPQTQLKTEGAVDFPWSGRKFVRQVYSGTMAGDTIWLVDSVLVVGGYVLQIRLVTNTKKHFEDFISNSNALSFTDRTPK